LKFGVAVEAGIARARERTHEAHLAVFGALEYVSGSPQERGRIFSDSFNDKAHMAIASSSFLKSSVHTER
jgi:hypothetical protein